MLWTRLATSGDAAAIAAIYNAGIAERIATFETEPRTTGQIAAQLVEKGNRFPTIVAEQEGRVVAWAGAGPYLDALCRAYAERGFWKIVSRIFPENTASLALHERCGFRIVGIYKRHGKLAGEWRDCVIVERLLDGAMGKG